MNATIGVAVASDSDPELGDALHRIQSALFDLGASLATPDEGHRRKSGVDGVGAADVDGLETLIDRLESGLEELKAFVLPGGSPAAAAFHVARTVCRRAERSVVRLASDPDESIEESSLRYLNRLSDLLFVIARHENARRGIADIPWTKRQG